MWAMLWVGLGGFFGANARYLVSGWAAERWGAGFPYGTFIINITGSFILGFFLAFAEQRPWVYPTSRLMFAIGFVGAYTTFSTYTYESILLMQDGQMILAVTNIVGSVLAGLVAVIAGLALGNWI